MEKAKLAFILVWLCMIVGSVMGYVMNIFKLVGCDFAPIGAEEALRIVGIFLAPLGAILGFFGHF